MAATEAGTGFDGVSCAVLGKEMSVSHNTHTAPPALHKPSRALALRRPPGTGLSVAVASGTPGCKPTWPRPPALDDRICRLVLAL
jgi:hypothetical protein